jgi:putative DNA primase/helicase
MPDVFDELAALSADFAGAKRRARRDSAPPDHTDPTEDATALAFAEANEGRIVFDHTAGGWRVWREGRWAADVRNSVFNAARDFTRAAHARLNEPNAAMMKIAFAAHVEAACRADPRLAKSHEIWDADPWLLGVPGGVVDLHTGVVGDANPAHYISRQTTVAPAPSGTDAPLWSGFIQAATGGNSDLAAFLQRLCGYILTGDVTEEVLAFLYGPGGNGKGVFLGAVVAILGDYATAVPIEVFTAGGRVSAEYYRAQMAGARLVVASETEAQATWAESQIKEMTGNEAPLSARHPYGKPFTFSPQFKIVLVGNHAPKLKGRSQAMERRLRVVPFSHRPATPDPGLKERMRSEYPAILRWMIDGCLLWQFERLGTAQAIKEATGAYFEQQDAFRRWMDERCNLVPTMSEKPGVLLADFNAWAKENGEDTTSSNAFAELIERTEGLRRQKSDGVRRIRGIGLRPKSRDGRDDQG